MKHSRADEIFIAEGLRWRQQETWFGERVDPAFAEKGAIVRLYDAPPEGSVVTCLDGMRPEFAKRLPGAQAVRQPAGKPLPRATQEIDDGRRGKGYAFCAFRPATGAAFTATYTGRAIANWGGFLAQVDQWLPAAAERVYAILDHLSSHRATDVLLCSLAHPRWAFVVQPTCAAYLNLSEPWWKTLRSLALKGKRFETWAEIEQAVAAATTYWNAHRHPFGWGRRHRQRLTRRGGLAVLPDVA